MKPMFSRWAGTGAWAYKLHPTLNRFNMGSLETFTFIEDDMGVPGLSDTPEFVEQVMETTSLHPDLFDLHTLMCTEHACQCKSPILPTSPMLSDISQCSALPPSAYAVSDFERTSYYNGIPTEGEHPELLYRTGSAKYPWIEPSSEHAYLPTKSLLGVHRTPLNDVWSTVGPQVSQLVRDRTNRYSIDPVRFVTHGEDGEETLGPVVIWVGVYPGSTSADTAHEVSQNILQLLEKNGIKDVEVEWREAVPWMVAL